MIKLILSIVVIVALGFLGAKKIESVKKADQQTPKAKVYPIVVKTIDTYKKDVTLSLPYLAEVENDKDVLLSSRIAARIMSIKKSGSHVRRGDIIARLDTTTIRSNIKNIHNQILAATVGLKNLEATHTRTKELLSVQGASIEESQKEATKIATLKAKIAGLKQKEIELQHNLSYALITSPVDGVIAKSIGSVGSMSMPGKALAKISANNGFYLRVRVPTDISVKKVRFAGKEYNAIALGSTFHGLAEYKVYMGNTKLTTGDRVEIDVITYDSKGVLLPFDAILNRNGKSYVLVVNKNKATLKEVHILQSAQEGVVILEHFSQKLVVAKPDILLKLTSGYALEVKE